VAQRARSRCMEKGGGGRRRVGEEGGGRTFWFGSAQSGMVSYRKEHGDI
jgi:hypothetical protein